MKKIIYILAFLAATLYSCGQAKPTVSGSDLQGQMPKPHTYSNLYRDYEYRTFFLTMRDGVKLAVDLYLPKSKKKAEKFPAIFHQTRYWRSVSVKFPVNVLKSKLDLQFDLGELKRKVISEGYAWIDVDVRGTGFSFGSRVHEFPQEEADDAVEIINWISGQEWCNGKIGLFGISYSGHAAELTLAKGHPAIKACVAMNSIFDVYTDNAFPGGVYDSIFVYNWGLRNAQQDSNYIPGVSKMQQRFFKGVTPVKGTRFKEVYEDHKKNWRVHEAVKPVQFRDDTLANGDYHFTVDYFSPHFFLDQINRSKVPIYVFGGWFDGAYQRGAFNRYLNLSKNTPHKLIIGPWSHAGLKNCSPYGWSSQQWGEIRNSAFDQAGQILRFFNYHIKGESNGINDEPPIYYFTMGEEKWKPAATWPLPFTSFDLYLAGNNQLTRQKTSSTHKIKYKVDTSATSGKTSRWKTLLTAEAVIYKQSVLDCSKTLCFTSAPLEKDLLVTGHPKAEIYLSSDIGDGSIFAYLEDIDSAGRPHMISEGMLRIIHQPATGEAPYTSPLPYYSFKKTDSYFPKPGEIRKVLVEILPTSFLFRKGHSIRIRIAGHDKDNFKLMTSEIPFYTFYYGGEYDAKLSLPVVSQ